MNDSNPKVTTIYQGKGLWKGLYITNNIDFILEVAGEIVIDWFKEIAVYVIL